MFSPQREEGRRFFASSGWFGVGGGLQSPGASSSNIRGSGTMKSIGSLNDSSRSSATTIWKEFGPILTEMERANGGQQPHLVPAVQHEKGWASTWLEKRKHNVLKQKEKAWAAKNQSGNLMYEVDPSSRFMDHTTTVV